MVMKDYFRAIVGTMILLSVSLSVLKSRKWLFFTTFIGLNLLQSAFTKWCLLEDILARLGVAKDCD